jgi:hypothetical protein
MWVARVCGLVLVMLVIGSCGKQSPDEQFAARANKMCRELRNEMRAGPPSPLVKELQHLFVVNRKLPVVRELRGDVVARRKLETTMSGLLRRMFAHPEDTQPMGEFHALHQRDVKLYEAERALGVGECVHPPIRAPIGG